MRFFIAAAALSLLVGQALAEDKQESPVLIGERGHVKLTAPACTKIDYVERFQQLIQENDRPAAMSFMISKVAASDCHMLAAGTEVFVEDLTIFHQGACVRESGKPDCLWTKNYFIGH